MPQLRGGWFLAPGDPDDQVGLAEAAELSRGGVGYSAGGLDDFLAGHGADEVESQRLGEVRQEVGEQGADVAALGHADVGLDPAHARFGAFHEFGDLFVELLLAVHEHGDPFIEHGLLFHEGVEPGGQLQEFAAQYPGADSIAPGWVVVEGLEEFVQGVDGRHGRDYTLFSRVLGVPPVIHGSRAGTRGSTALGPGNEKNPPGVLVGVDADYTCVGRIRVGRMRQGRCQGEWGGGIPCLYGRWWGFGPGRWTKRGRLPRVAPGWKGQPLREPDCRRCEFRRSLARLTDRA